MFQVTILTPDGVFLDTSADELILPSSTGQLGILTDHAPLLTSLDSGVMRLKYDGSWTSIFLTDGFAEVNVDEKNKVTILCPRAEEGSSIDLKTAQDELEKVTLLVEEATTKKDKIEATTKLRTAKARLQAAADTVPKKFSSVYLINDLDDLFGDDT